MGKLYQENANTKKKIWRLQINDKEKFDIKSTEEEHRGCYFILKDTLRNELLVIDYCGWNNVAIKCT